jgi:hypothetical protein
MEKTYYIYEIPGVKIGCTYNLKKRIKKQGYVDYKILEQHTDIMEASKREIELQRKHGYKVDTIPYYKTLLIPTTEGCRKAGKLAGKRAVESGQLASVCSKGGKNGGKIQGKKNKESGQIVALGKASRKLTFEQAEEIREKFYKMDGGKMERYDTLAFQYNVSSSAIQFIIQNKTYTEK